MNFKPWDTVDFIFLIPTKDGYYKVFPNNKVLAHEYFIAKQELEFEKEEQYCGAV